MKQIHVALILFILASSPTAAFAHPFTDETIPSQSSSVAVGTSEVVVIYSEGVELGFSVLKVFDGNGDRVDNEDTKYHEGDYSLSVTTAPLEEGVYTVTSKVLSKVDGHLVDYAFVFAVGDAEITELEPPSPDLIFLPEAGARFPGLVGQTIVLGAVIASMLVWGTQRKDLAGNNLKRLEGIIHDKFISLVGFGLIVVFASNILMLTVQTMRLEASAFDVLQTSFGTTWIIRMTITVALLGVWFGMERIKRLSFRGQVPLLALSLILIGTTTMLSHGMASEQPPAIILDYIHNLVAAAWIGGTVFLAFTLLPSLDKLDVGERLALAAIPRFSIMAVIAIGIVIVSGPLLMWLLESNVGVIVESTYGKLIIIKILLAAGMIGIGGYHQFRVQRIAEREITVSNTAVCKKMKRSLKLEVILGVMLLGVVALLTNGTLPEGEIQSVQAQTVEGFSTLEFAGQTKFEIDIFPFAPGTNTITIKAAEISDHISDIEGIKVKISNPQRNIAPIVIPMESDSEANFHGNATFGFSGMWQLEVEAQRTQNANDGTTLNLLIKPRLNDLAVKITEYDFPKNAGAPLYPEFDGRGNIWITDASKPYVWKFSITDEEFTKYEFDGQASVILTIDNKENVWFTDIGTGQLGYVNPESGESRMVEFPDIAPVTERNYPIMLDVDSDNGVWVSVTNKNVLVRYDQDTDSFETYSMPSKDSRPLAVTVDTSDRVWFSQQIGQIGYIDRTTGKTTEIIPATPLATPETITLDSDGSLWIAEHQEYGAVTRYDPLLDSFERISSPDDTAFPNSAVIDRYQNVWFALHTVDKMAAYDPHRNEIIEVPIPTAESWVQFTTSDNAKNIWFVEQKPAKLAVLETTEKIPSIVQRTEPGLNLQYTELASPLIALGIVAASLFFVKGIRDKRRINALVYGPK